MQSSRNRNPDRTPGTKRGSPHPHRYARSLFIVDVPVRASEPDALYPTDSEWDDIASFLCENAFKAYTGVNSSDPTSDLSSNYLMSLESDCYDVESRLLSCAVVAYDGTRLTGPGRI